MKELILPLCRTVFLPPASPGIDTLCSVTGDLRNVRCSSFCGELYCSGEVDILIEYTSCARATGIFNKSSSAAPPSEPWQALLSFPFQLSSPVDVTEGCDFYVHLANLNWSMITARALELEGELQISYDAAEAEDAVSKEQMPANTLVKKEEQRHIQKESAYIVRENAVSMSENDHKEYRQGGEWKMVSLERENNKKEELNLPVDTRPVEIVDLMGEHSESDLRDVIARVLTDPDMLRRESAAATVIERPLPKDDATETVNIAEAEQVPASNEEAASAENENRDSYTISVVFPHLQEQEHKDEQAVEAEAYIVDDSMHDEDDAKQVIEQFAEQTELEEEHSMDNMEQEMEQEEVILPEEGPGPDEKPMPELMPEPDYVPAPMPKPTPKPEPAPMPEPIPESEPEPDCDADDQCTPEPATDDCSNSGKAVKKRRYQCIPSWRIEANNNDIDLTAFKINIKF